MNLLHISTADIIGGAAKATYQIHCMLKSKGHRSVMAVRKRASNDRDVIEMGIRSIQNCNRSELSERFLSRLAGGYHVKLRPFVFFNKNLAPIPDWEGVLDQMPNPDIIFLHWVTNMLTVADIRRLAERVGCPIVWILMDMEPMTGGCHYTGGCSRYTEGCHNCPQLKDCRRIDWAERTWHEKYAMLKDLPISFVAPTQWLLDRLKKSKIFKEHSVEKIPLPVHECMVPLEQSSARSILGLPLDKKIILIGSHNILDPRKGMEILIRSTGILNKLLNGRKDILFVVIGENGRKLCSQIPFDSINLGYIDNDIELSLIYSASDIFACTSVEDAGPMMVSQAMMCSTSVVAFGTGIASELLSTEEGGYLARLGDADDFARGLKKMLEHDGITVQHAHEIAASHHDPKYITRKYEEMINKLVKISNSKV